MASDPDWFHFLSRNAEVVTEGLPNGANLIRIRSVENFKTNAKPTLELRDLIVKRGARMVIGLDNHNEPTGLNFTLYEGEIVVLGGDEGELPENIDDFGGSEGYTSEEMKQIHTDPLEGIEGVEVEGDLEEVDW